MNNFSDSLCASVHKGFWFREWLLWWSADFPSRCTSCSTFLIEDCQLRFSVSAPRTSWKLPSGPGFRAVRLIDDHVPAKLVTNQMFACKHNQTKSCRLIVFHPSAPSLPDSSTLSLIRPFLLSFTWHVFFIHFLRYLHNSFNFIFLSPLLPSFPSSLAKNLLPPLNFCPLKDPRVCFCLTLDLFLSFISFSVPSHHYTPSWMPFILHPFIPLSFAFPLFCPIFIFFFFFTWQTASVLVHLVPSF